MSLKNILQKKELLYKTSDGYKRAIKNDIDDLKINVRKWGKDVLLIGGTLVAGYSLVKIFFNYDLPDKYSKQADNQKDKSAERDKNISATNPSPDPISIIPDGRVGSHDSIIVRMIKEQVTAFLLDLAKKKLTEFLAELQTKKSQEKRGKEENRNSGMVE